MIEQETETKDITVTYETLFEILRNEKTKEDLQKLHDTFFQDVVSYLNEKQSSINEKKEQQSLFGSDEKEKLIHQIGNIKRILRDIYERREKKIISMALNKSRFTSNIIDTSALLNEEKLFYDLTVSLLDNQRDRILNMMLNGKIPEEKKIEVSNSTSSNFESADSLVEKKIEAQTSAKLIRFLAAVPQFIGGDMREYGPYEEEDIAKIPVEIADVLIQKERAEEIKES
jgi:DNA replication factor GINS